ncbi:MAG TPA: hypothetical protein VF525_15520 [Pyrinomonadaceae bacterium]|jgi:hypothetical protein
MKRRASFTFGIALLLALGAARGLAAVDGNEDTDGQLVGARVVEINSEHISVMARSGVEHVIAIDRAGTRIKRGDKYISFADLHTDDIVTVELDAAKQVKFAKQIEVTRQSGDQVARTPR